jgi:hypothetical protein
MNTYRVDFPLETLQRDKDVRSRLMRDMRKVAKTVKGETKPRFLWKRRTDRSLGYWFQVDTDLQKDKKAMELLKPYGLAPSSPPVLPESEWQRL